MGGDVHDEVCVKAVRHVSYMQIRNQREQELVNEDAFAVAPLTKQQMWADAEPEAPRSGAVGQQHSKPRHPRSRWDGEEPAGRGHAVQGLCDAHSTELRARTGAGGKRQCASRPLHLL